MRHPRSWRRFMMVTGLLATALGLFVAAVPAARASPAAAHVVFGPPTEGSKLTLGETSIDGPALWALPAATPRVILAWTGTDPAHRLNVMTGGDGFHYAAKRTLPETSPHRPAVAFDSSGRAGFVVLAWTGTDAAHTLNVEYLDAGTLATVRKLTLWGRTSFDAPAVAVYGGGELALAWTDKAQNPNVMRISPQGQVLGQVSLGQRLFAFGGAPNLSYDPGMGKLLMSWIEPARNYSPLFFSTSTDAVQWSPLRSIGEYSGSAPSMLGIRAVNMPTHWLAWTGTGLDTAHHLNVQYTESFPNWVNVNSKATIAETAYGAPALGYVGEPRRLLVAWTGTDPAHHLNVAIVYVPS